MRLTTWQIYGPQDTEGSWCRVAAGLKEGLTGCRQAVDFFPTDSVGHDLDRPLPAGFDADVGIFVGPPAHARMMRGQGAHKERWLMLAPNSTWLPTDVLEELERTEAVTGYLTPSCWGANVLKLYTERPVRVWRHGVSGAVHRGAFEHHEREVSGAAAVRSPFVWKCLHLSSSQAGRKGTHELVRAFVEVVEAEDFLPEGVKPRLTVIVDGPVGDVEAVLDQAAETERGHQAVVVQGRQDMSPARVGDLMAAHDCVVQPSRAEGFGMVPLEARVCGVPVIMTNGTGHSEHVPERTATVKKVNNDGFAGGYFTRDGVCVIWVGEMAPIDDGPNGRAPTYSDRALVAALEAACLLRHRMGVWAAARAAATARTWSWTAQTQRFLEQHLGEKAGWSHR